MKLIDRLLEADDKKVKGLFWGDQNFEDIICRVDLILEELGATTDEDVQLSKRKKLLWKIRTLSDFEKWRIFHALWTVEKMYYEWDEDCSNDDF